MATNPTPERYDELLASGEDLADGAQQHGATISLAQNTEAKIRTDLGAMTTTRGEFKAAETAEAPAYSALRTADSNSKGFIAAAINAFKATLGTSWNANWIATGLPDNSLGVPRTQDKRFAALNGLKTYLTNNPNMEVSTPSSPSPPPRRRRPARRTLQRRRHPDRRGPRPRPDRRSPPRELLQLL